MQPPPLDVTQFSAVDQTTAPTAFVHFMDDSHAQQAMQHYTATLLEHLTLSPGASVLDVGCGTGHDALVVRQTVGPQGRVVGVDTSDTMLATARERAAKALLSIDFVRADATHMPFADATFDACLASRVLGHLHEPALAITEMLRVVRPGGRIVLADGDLDLLAIDIADRSLARKIIHAVCDQSTQGWMGRQLHRYLLQAGGIAIRVEGRLMPLDYGTFAPAFRGIIAQTQATGAVTADDVTVFWQSIDTAEQTGTFFARIGGFIVSGQKSLQPGTRQSH